jgi:hypothetical protein
MDDVFSCGRPLGACGAVTPPPTPEASATVAWLCFYAIDGACVVPVHALALTSLADLSVMPNACTLPQ